MSVESALRTWFPPLDSPRPGARRFTARSHPELATVLPELADALGGVSYRALMVGGASSPIVAVEDTAPPTLYISREVDHLPAAEVRFVLGGALAQVRLRHTLPARLGVAQLGEVVNAILAVVVRSSAVTATPAVAKRAAQLEEALDSPARAALADLCRDLSAAPLEPARWLHGIALSEDRLSLALCGDIRAAVHAVLRADGGEPSAVPRTSELSATAGPRLRHLLGFAVSEEYLALRELPNDQAG